MDLPSKTGQQRTCQSKQSKQHFGMELPSKTGQQRTCQSKQSENGSYDLARTCSARRRCAKGQVNYHWRELPQVSFLSRQAFCCDKHVFLVTKYVKIMLHTFVATNTCLSGQTFCRDKYNFVATNVLSRQAYFCHDKKKKTCFVVTNTCLS